MEGELRGKRERSKDYIPKKKKKGKQKKKNSFFWKIKKKENPFTTDQKKEDHNPRPTNNQVLASQCATVHASHFDFLLEIFY